MPIMMEYVTGSFGARLLFTGVSTDKNLFDVVFVVAAGRSVSGDGGELGNFRNKHCGELRSVLSQRLG